MIDKRIEAIRAGLKNIPDNGASYRRDMEYLLAQYDEVHKEFLELVKACEWYAGNGTDQERDHFLAVEARGNFYDIAMTPLSLPNKLYSKSEDGK